jgi:hypothetical protein
MTSPNPPAEQHWFRALSREGKKLGLFAFDAARRLWGVIQGPIVFFLNLIAALVVLFEEWGWRPLSELLAKLAKFRPIAVIEGWIGRLPPYGALVVFALPTTILMPVKLLGLWLLARGAVVTAGAMLIAAKIVSTALVARIFMLTKPALMRLSWFAALYNWFIPWKEHFFGLIRASWIWRYGRMVKTRIKLEVKQAWMRWKPSIDALIAQTKPRLRQVWARVREGAMTTWGKLFGGR